MLETQTLLLREAGGNTRYAVNKTWKADEQVAMRLREVELGEVQNWATKSNMARLLVHTRDKLCWIEPELYPTNLPISQLYIRPCHDLAAPAPIWLG